jgi:RNA polymerase sigma-70 factor (ECF subfamily)
LIHEILKSLKKNQWQESFEDLDSTNINFDWNGEIIEKITAKELTEMIQNLPFGFRIIFNMYEIEGYSHREIAGELNISVGTSKSQLSRAKKAFQHKIQMLF